ncbi:response regulator [Amycolatopsis keratiniphila]|uniref:Response regulatory domain-containing protein n=1 Tax=Amycolatopsis keratiniphila subsp. keratiniphila TaxID=227715 RepID=A0A1W2M2V0_9PSEU|nr:response regulator transcription factor [Amycolatopsis keratiniphila]ONF74367.1 hypothetical protein AVR91_0203500 [Amycolatopsis keratiniphila subsp. keratiniphila]
MIRVLLSDDEPLTRAGIAADPEIEVVAQAENGRQAVELAVAHRPEVALLDIVMPVLDGLAAVTEITRAVPGTGVLMLTTFSADEQIVAALDGGARGFLHKTGGPRELWLASARSPGAVSLCRTGYGPCLGRLEHRKAIPPFESGAGALRRVRLCRPA